MPATGPSTAIETRYGLVPGTLGYALAFALVFGGIVLACWSSGTEASTAVIQGALALLFIRFFARSVVPAMQRRIDAFRSVPNEPKADAIPLWAVAVYALIGVLFLLPFVLDDFHLWPAITFVIAWAAGWHLLDGFRVRRDGTTLLGTAFEVFDERLDVRYARHRRVLYPLSVVLCFVLLAGGVTWHAYEYGLARHLLARCGACATLPMPEHTVAILCGTAAILYVALYARLTGALQRRLIDPWKYVRPEPAPARPPRWAVVVHVLIGFTLFFWMAGFASESFMQEQTLGNTYISGKSKESGKRVVMGGGALLVLALGWWIGGRGVLKFFWPKAAIPVAQR